MLAISSRLWLSLFFVAAAGFGLLLYAETYVPSNNGTFATAPFPNPVHAEAQLAAAREDDIALQNRVARAVLSARPGDPSAWLRLAYVYSYEDVSFRPNALRALKNSYKVAPYAAGLTPWRLDFALRHWRSLDDEVRSAAIAEAMIVKQDPPRLYRVTKLAHMLAPGDGKVAAFFLGLL